MSSNKEKRDRIVPQPMLPDNVIMLLWMLVFFVIFYIYIDVRLTKLRKEMLEHYRQCEKLVTQGVSSVSKAVSSYSSRSSPLISPSEQIFSSGNDDLDLVPSKEETAYGLLTINGMKKDDNASWVTKENEAQGGLEPYNICSDSGDYAMWTGPA
jgi:hypothetical protein